MPDPWLTEKSWLTKTDVTYDIKFKGMTVKSRMYDIDVIGYNIFDRITKEGRKYGVLMGFITQRPSELSKTALSQCSNFLVFRIFHPDDYEIIDSITSSVTRDDLNNLKTLRRGMALTFGTAFNLPMIVKLDMPNPMPSSSNVDIVNKWYENNSL